MTSSSTDSAFAPGFSGASSSQPSATPASSAGGAATEPLRGMDFASGQAATSFGEGGAGPLSQTQAVQAAHYNASRWSPVSLLQLQNRLGAPGTGASDEPLAQAAGAFQQARSLGVDGKIGPATSQTILSEAGPTLGIATHPLGPAQTAQAVQYNAAHLAPEQTQPVQATLGAPQTGRSDDGTALAAYDYQTRAGLYPDGKVGPLTFNSLLSAGLSAVIPALPSLPQERIALAIEENTKIGKQAMAKQVPLIFRVRHFLRLSVNSEKGAAFTAPVDEALVTLIAAFQQANWLQVDALDGILTPKTQAVMAAQGMGARTSAEWQGRDEEDRIAVGVDEEFYRQLGKSIGTREAIVKLAESQIGSVSTVNRGDGNKFGHERIRRYYEVALGAETFAKFIANTNNASGIRRAGRFAGDTTDNQDEHVGTWSWCGIFAMWAVRSVTGNGEWDTSGAGEQGFTRRSKAELDQAQPGDIIRFNTSNAHRAILKELVPVEGKPGVFDVRTVDGNSDMQNILHAYHPYSTISDFLQTV